MKIKFIGIDDFNRAIYKAIDKSLYFGSTQTLFSFYANQEEVDDYFKDNIQELEYFGKSFNCEPNGGKINNLKII